MAALVNNDESDLTSSMSLVDEQFLTTNIYLLWTSNPEDEYKIQAVFGSAVHHDFEFVDEFQLKSREKTVVFRLKHQKPMSSLSHQGKGSRGEEFFSMRISTKAMGIVANYNDSTPRIADFNVPHQFLFDIKFQIPLLLSAKGE